MDYLLKTDYLLKLTRSIDRTVSQISRILLIVGMFAVILMMLISVSDIILRYFFSRPILDSAEMIQYLMVVIGFCGLAWCGIKGIHVVVDLLVANFPSRVQAIIDSITFILCLTVVPLVAWQGFVGAMDAYQANKGSSILGIPAYPFYIIQGIGFTLLTIVVIILISKSILKAVKR